MSIKTVSSAATHVGMVREINEDSFIDKNEVGLWAVADGMGGHEAGEVASQAVVRALADIENASNFEESLEEVRRQLEAVNYQLVDSSKNFPPNRVPGTTVAALLIHDKQGATLWAGDSRIYRKRNGVIKLLTKDHSHVQSLLDRDLISPEDAEKHPMANVITRAIGIEDPVRIDIRTFKVLRGDQFLLCSDGLSRLVQSFEMADLLKNQDKDEIVQSLLRAALDRGAPDNVTLIYVGRG